MSLYTIGDLHLSFSVNKPMDIFGDNWKNYEQKIQDDWLKKVHNDDTIVIPGDFSWATYLEETEKDFEFINSLPGRKILLKGNHDYWWNTVTKMNNYLKEKEFKNIEFLHNNSYLINGTIIAGTKGWNISEEDEDIRLTAREVQRLELSIQSGISQFGSDKEIIVFMHYPPLTSKYMETDYTKLMHKYGIKRCYYAHLHAEAIQNAIEGEIQGINYTLVSADALNFKILKIK